MMLMKNNGLEPLNGVNVDSTREYELGKRSDYATRSSETAATWNELVNL